MKAAVYTRKILDIREVEKPVPKDNEVLIKVRAASVNPLDWRMKSRRPGVDVAGEVEAVGKRVTRFKPGDAVFGAAHGAFAEYACAQESRVVLKPNNVTFEEAASLPVAGLTALQGLRDRGQLKSGQKVLINGAAGGVGTFSVQIAKLFGGTVAGVCSTRNVDMVRSLGAEQVIDYTREDFARDGHDYDLLLDNVGNRSLSAYRHALAPHGKCVMAGAPKKLWAALLYIVKVWIAAPFFRQKFTFMMANVNPRDLETLGELTNTRKIAPVIDRRYPLSEAAAALAYGEGGHARAKVLITPD